MQIRVGDTVQIEGEVVEVSQEQRSNPIVKLASGINHVVARQNITRVISRPETDAEKIARLEHEVEALTLFKDFAISRGWVTTPSDHDDLSKQTYDVRVGDAQQSAYDKQPRCAELATGMSRFETRPWYPPQLEGYGPWTEGTPPKDFTGTAQLLMKSERNCETYCEGAYFLERGFVLGCDYVAYCVKL